MTTLFLHPPFDTPAILARVVADVPAIGPAATLAGHTLREDGHGLRIALAAGEGTVAGRLVRMAPEDRGRLDFAMAALGAEPVRVVAEGPDGPVEAVAYRFPAAAIPSAASDGAASGRLAETLAEVMELYGQRPAAEVPDLLYGIGVRALGRSRGVGRDSPVALGSGLGAGDVELVERRQPYTRYFAVEEHRLRHRRFDGGVSDTLERAVFTSGDAVVVLPYDPARDSVLLIEQFRAGPWARRDPRPWRLETVAGRCDRSEDPEATARREAREEAGLDLGRIERIGGFYSSPAIMSEYITAFVAEADLGTAGGVFGLPEEHEDIRAEVVPLAAALAAVRTGEIDTAPLMLVLFWLELNAARLRQAWGG